MVGDVVVGISSCGDQGIVSDVDIMVYFVFVFDILQNVDGILDCWFVDNDGLEFLCESDVFFDQMVFCEGCSVVVLKFIF